MSAGKLNERIKFLSPGIDARGDPRGPLEVRFTIWGGLEYLRGSEVAVSHRLEGRQPATILVRDSADARLITEAWVAEVMTGPRKGEQFNIKSAAPAREPRMISLMGVSGVAVN